MKILIIKNVINFIIVICSSIHTSKSYSNLSRKQEDFIFHSSSAKSFYLGNEN